MLDIENIHFEGMKIQDILTLCLKCDDKDDAKKVLEKYEQYCDTPEIARTSLGYIFGYCCKDDREKLYSLFHVNHPIFGECFGREKQKEE